jgi:hypothetical protein
MQAEIRTLDCGEIDRRKLEMIARGDDRPLLLSEINALDRYFESKGKRLLDRPGLVPALAERGEVDILIGARLDKAPSAEKAAGTWKAARNATSMWDVRALAAVLRELDRARPQTRYEITPILGVNSGPTPPRPAGGQGWWPNPDRKPEANRSTVSIGGPRSSPVAERMLAEMFNLEPYRVPNLREWTRPFLFVWPSDAGQSCMSIDVPEARRFARNPTSEDGPSGLIIDRDLFIVPNDQKAGRGTTVGVLAAQRRPKGQVWLLLAGIDGPATYALAYELPSLSAQIDLPQLDGSGRSPVIWAAVRAEVLWDVSVTEWDSRWFAEPPRIDLITEPRTW